MNDVEIVNDEHFKVGEKLDEYIYRVDIDNVTENHCGKIKVVGKNENGEDCKEVRQRRWLLRITRRTIAVWPNWAIIKSSW